MATWAEFTSAATEMSMAGRALLYHRGAGEALLATVNGDMPPRIHPIAIAIIEGRLFGFIVASPKQVDLERDGRYALHSFHAPSLAEEFEVRGRARLVDGEERSHVAAAWYFSVDATYTLFEFSIESALHGIRSSPAAWPPIYSTWRAR